MKLSFLVIDQDSATQPFLRSLFSEQEVFYRSVRGLEDAREELTHRAYDVVFIDTALIEETAHDGLRDINDLCPGAQIVMLGRHSTPELDLVSLGENIFGVLSRPLDADAVRCLVRQIFRLKAMAEAIEKRDRKAAEESLKNSVTGLYTERYLHERISAEFERAKRYVFSLSVVLLLVKPRSGSREARNLLEASLSNLLTGFVRKNDVVTHYGENRYLFLLPDTGKKGALVFAGRLLAALPQGLPSVFQEMELLLAAGAAGFPEDGVKNEMGLLDLVERAAERAERSGDGALFAFKGLESFDIQNLIPPRKKAV